MTTEVIEAVVVTIVVTTDAAGMLHRMAGDEMIVGVTIVVVAGTTIEDPRVVVTDEEMTEDSEVRIVPLILPTHSVSS